MPCVPWSLETSTAGDARLEIVSLESRAGSSPRAIKFLSFGGQPIKGGGSTATRDTRGRCSAGGQPNRVFCLAVKHQASATSRPIAANRHRAFSIASRKLSRPKKLQGYTKAQSQPKSPPLLVRPLPPIRQPTSHAPPHRSFPSPSDNATPVVLPFCRSFSLQTAPQLDLRAGLLLLSPRLNISHYHLLRVES